MILGHLQAIAPEVRLFEFLRDVLGIIVFAMPAKAQQLGRDQLRPPASAGLRHRVTEGVQAFSQVGAVHFMGRHAVADGLVGQIAAGELARVRRRVGILIIGHHQNQRQSFNRRLI